MVGGFSESERCTPHLLVTRLQTISSLPLPTTFEKREQLSVLEKDIQSFHITAKADFVKGNISFCTKTKILQPALMILHTLF